MNHDWKALSRVLALLVLAVAMFPPRAGNAQDFRKLESEIAAVLKTHGVPGASIAVTVGERIVWATGLGVAESGADRSVQLGTLFQAASISKPVAALAALRLVEDGKLALDLPVAKYLKNTRWLAQDDVTLRQLLSHTSGLSVSGFGGYPRGRPIPTLEQILLGKPPANSAPVVLQGRPGMQFKYSGGGYSVMQQLVIDATGAPFPRAMAMLVLSPLAMNDSTYEQPLPETLASRAATGHDSKSRPIPGSWNTYPEMAAAGLWTTASDLARYILAVQKAYSGQGGTPIRTETAREMLRRQFQGDIGLGPFAPGLGQFVSQDGPDAKFSHLGINNGYKCRVVATKSIGHGLIIMTNGDNGDRIYAAVQRLVDAAFALN